MADMITMKEMLEAVVAAEIAPEVTVRAQHELEKMAKQRDKRRGKENAELIERAEGFAQWLRERCPEGEGLSAVEIAAMMNEETGAQSKEDEGWVTFQGVGAALRKAVEKGWCATEDVPSKGKSMKSVFFPIA